MAPLTLVRSEKLPHQVARVLAARIVNAEYEARPTPTEQEIVDEFGVSKTVAREVMGLLVSMRLVRVRHGRRMVIRSTAQWNYFDPRVIEVLGDSHEIRRLLSELHQVRVLIEPEVAALAATKASPEHLSRLRVHLDAMMEKPVDPEAYLEHDVAFHGELVAAVGNRIIAQIVDSTAELLRASRRVTQLLPHALDMATRGHAAVYEAVAQHDAEGARQAMLDHLAIAVMAWTDPDSLSGSSESAPTASALGR